MPESRIMKKKKQKKFNVEKAREAKRRHNFPLIPWAIGIKHERAGNIVNI